MCLTLKSIISLPFPRDAACLKFILSSFLHSTSRSFASRQLFHLPGKKGIGNKIFLRRREKRRARKEEKWTRRPDAFVWITP